MQSRYEEGPRWVGFPSFSHDPSSKHFIYTYYYTHEASWCSDWVIVLTNLASNLLECCLLCGSREGSHVQLRSHTLDTEGAMFDLLYWLGWFRSVHSGTGREQKSTWQGRRFSVRSQATMHEIPWHLTVLLIYSEGKHQMAHFWDLTLSFARKTDTVLLPIPTWFLTFLEVWPAGNRFFCGGCILSELVLPILKMFRPTLAK